MAQELPNFFFIVITTYDGNLKNNEEMIIIFKKLFIITNRVINLTFAIITTLLKIYLLLLSILRALGITFTC